MQMMQKLQLKIILMTVLILTVVFGLIFLTINLYIKNSINNQVSYIFEEVIENDGVTKTLMSPPRRDNNMPGDFTPPDFEDEPEHKEPFERKNPEIHRDMENNPKEPPIRDFDNPHRNENNTFSGPIRNSFWSLPFDIHSIRNYFSVKLDSEKNISEIISGFPIAYSETEIIDIVKETVSLNKDTGLYTGLRFCITEKSYGFLLVFIDVRIEQNLTFQLLRISIIAYVVSLFFALIIAYFFSLFAIKPVQNSFENQKQFIADASHELKTPLAVINANVDVLENEIGSNRWIMYIQNEIKRMDKLVKSLLYLSKVDNHEKMFVKKNFDLSRLIESVVLSFEPLAFEKEIQIQTQIDDSIMFFGDEEKIKECLLVFLDNAVKYSFEKGLITVSLSENNGKKCISIKNTGIGIKQEDLQRIFNRFYRADISRDRDTGGYGLGLSIAQSIVNQHKGKILVNSEYNSWAEFIIQL